MKRQRGLTVIETMVALAVLTLVATSVLVGEGAQLRGVGRSFDELAASRAAAGRIEELKAGPVSIGTTEFDGGVQIVRRLEPGLLEVTVRVNDFELVTLMEERR